MKLRPPEGFDSHDPTRRIVMPDCQSLYPDGNGFYDFGDDYGRPGGYLHMVDHYKNQGWREPEKPKPTYRDEFEKEAALAPLNVGKLLELCEKEKVEVRVQDDRLWIRGASISPRLRAHLNTRRDVVVHELQLRAARAWEEVV